MAKIVIFVGSGLSKSLADIPIQEDFLPAVLTKERKKRVLDPIEDEQERERLEKWDDSEMLLSYLYYQDTVTKTGCNDRPYKKAIINFRMALNEYLADFPQPTDEHASENFQKLLDISKENDSEYSIITTNYDLLIENVMTKRGNQAKTLEKISYGLTDIKHAEQTTLLKLHGSINWIEERCLPKGELRAACTKARLPQHILENIKKIRATT